MLEMGSAVIHGAFSTFLAVLILSTSKSYIFRIFFKQVDYTRICTHTHARTRARTHVYMYMYMSHVPN